MLINIHIISLQYAAVRKTVESYMKEFDTDSGIYKPTGVYSVYLADTGLLTYVFIPEVCFENAFAFNIYAFS